MATPSKKVLDARADECRLLVGGTEFAGWKSISITTSIEEAASSFTVSAAAKWDEGASPVRISPNQSVEVYLGDDRVITGWIDRVDVSYDSGSHDVSVSGRSKVADLVDSHAVPATYQNLRIEQLASTLTAPFGVTVRALVDTGAKIPRVRVQARETAYSVIERVARSRALLITDDADGNLVLTRAGLSRAHTGIVLGSNVLSCSASFDGSQRFSEYRCKGQLVGDDQNWGDSLVTEESVADEDIARYRLLYVEPEPLADAARCRVRATWEAAQRYGRSVQMTYQVVGWRQGDGSLWQKGLKVQVTDDWVGVDDEFVIVSVTYELSDAGTMTTLELTPPEAYEALPPHVPRRRPGARNGKWFKGPVVLPEGAVSGT